MYEVTILNIHACYEHKIIAYIWIDHIATDASIEYEAKENIS